MTTIEHRTAGFAVDGQDPGLFTVARFEGEEKLSRPYWFQMDLVADSPAIELAGILGHRARLTLQLFAGPRRAPGARRGDPLPLSRRSAGRPLPLPGAARAASRPARPPPAQPDLRPLRPGDHRQDRRGPAEGRLRRRRKRGGRARRARPGGFRVPPHPRLSYPRPCRAVQRDRSRFPQPHSRASRHLLFLRAAGRT